MQRVKIVSTVYRVYECLQVQGWIRPLVAAPTFETSAAAVAYVEKFGEPDQNYVIHGE